MISDDLEIVRKIVAAWNRGESGRDYMSPEIEYVNPENAVEPGTRIGPETFLKVTDIYEWRISRAEYHEVGGQILALANGEALARGSGIKAPINHGYVFTIEDGLLVRFHWYAEQATAIEAVGLASGAEPLDVDDPP